MTVWFSKAVSGTCTICKLWQKKYGYLETVLNSVRLSIHTWTAVSQEQLTKCTYAESVTKFLGTLWKIQFLEKYQNLDPRFTNLSNLLKYYANLEHARQSEQLVSGPYIKLHFIW